MKQIKLLLILAIGLLFINTSCSLEKRVHSTGYHVDWNNNNNNNNNLNRLQQKELIIRDKHKSVNSLDPSGTSSVLNIKSPILRSGNEAQAQAQPARVEKIKEVAQTVKEEILLALKGKSRGETAAKSPEGEYEPFAIIGFVAAMAGLLGLVIWPVGVLLFILSIVFSAVALQRIRENPKLKGKTLALVGLYVGIVLMSIVIALLALFLLLLSTFSY
jgi:hypothetical protein